MNNSNNRDPRNNVLIVTGSAPRVHDDIASARLLAPDATYMAVGLDAVDLYIWRLEYVATYHPQEVAAIWARRSRAGGNTDYVVISHKTADGVDIVIPFTGPSGSSALLACQAAIRVLKYAKIILCGCPLDDKKYQVFRLGWEHHNNRREVMGRVKSMSGWTRDHLGAPSKDWIQI
jgi:hypothetical protein